MDKPEGEDAAKETKVDTSFGAWLKNQRIEKKVSLEEIAAVTKVHIAQLRALEENDAKKLPAAAFVRGFLVTYSRHLNLDEDEVLQKYKGFKELTTGTLTDMLVPNDNKLGRSLSHPKVRIVTPPQFNPAATTKPHLEQKPSSTINMKTALWSLSLLAIVVLIGSLVTIGRKNKVDAGTEKEKPAAVADAGGEKSNITPTPQETSPLLAVPTPPPPLEEKTTATKVASKAPLGPINGPVGPMNSLLEIRALDDNFINIRIDDGTARGVNLKAGTLSPFPANRRVRLSMSNAGALEFKWNGVWYSAPGTRGEVKSLIFPDQIASLTVKPPPPKIKPVVAPPAAALPSTEAKKPSEGIGSAEVESAKPPVETE